MNKYETETEYTYRQSKRFLLMLVEGQNGWERRVGAKYTLLYI